MNYKEAKAINTMIDEIVILKSKVAVLTRIQRIEFYQEVSNPDILLWRPIKKKRKGQNDIYLL